ncbi:dihydrodipicolinate synthase family protein [Cytobacillus firmus]|uniref:dihydrodipicolinate synthase family protein n=1 Tax=Paenibacillus lautus TaxID=1401 RepID=UPI00384F2980|nr:dihydrodipicolinate synthase family protein [Cytobacillus firmus]
MYQIITGGNWPVMLTPFTEKNNVDYEALERLIDWYIERGADGLFAVCQSSEMYTLTLEERVLIAAFVKAKAAGRVPVIASGHVSDAFEDQVTELNAMAETGVDAVVLITNRLAAAEESDDVWLANLDKLLGRLPEQVPLGLYECPAPYRRLLTPEMLKKCSDTGRFRFIKDVSCDLQLIGDKLKAVRGGSLKIFNANTATLLDSYRLGAFGFSGVMANFHPELYTWLFRNWESQPEAAGELSDFLSVSSFLEKQLYPVNAKYYLMLEGILTNYRCRSKNHEEFSATQRLEIEQLYRVSKQYARKYPVFT